MKSKQTLGNMTLIQVIGLIVAVSSLNTVLLINLLT